MKTRFKDRADPSNPLSVEKQAQSASAVKSSQADSAKKAFSSKKSKAEQDSQTFRINLERSQVASQNSARSDLMTRLVSGAKAKVDSRDMKRLTRQAYERLPEVQKRKEDARRREADAEGRRRIAAL